MTTIRRIRDDLQNALDFLVDAELALFANGVSYDNTRVSWHSSAQEVSFLGNFGAPSVDQYFQWLQAGHYSALLFDASLIQVTYDLDGGDVIGHRLCYFPCPYDIDSSLLRDDVPFDEVVSLYFDSDAVLRTPLRFDFDRTAAGPGHSASHLTLNGVDCRIPCIAPLHVLRFLDFVFDHFYSDLHLAHQSFFEPSAWQHIEFDSTDDWNPTVMHVSWDVHATATGGSIGR